MMDRRCRPMKLIDGAPHYPCAGKCTADNWLPKASFPPANYGICPVKSRCYDCQRKYARERNRRNGTGVRGKAGPDSPALRQQAADAERIAKLVAERRAIDVMPILAGSLDFRQYLRGRAS